MFCKEPDVVAGSTMPRLVVDEIMSSPTVPPAPAAFAPRITPPANPGEYVASAPVVAPADAVHPIIVQVPAQAGGADGFDLVIAVMGLLGALAWPVVVGVALWSFRDAIRAKLADAESVDVLGFKLIMRRVTKEAEKIASDVDALEEAKPLAGEGPVDPVNGVGNKRVEVRVVDSTAAAESATSPGPVPRPFKFSDDHAAVFHRLANVDPKAAILYQWNLIEEKVAALAEAYEYKAVPPASTVHDFITLGALASPEVRAVMNDLRRARDSAAHVRDGFSYEDALNYREAALAVIRHLDWQIAQATAKPG